MTRPDEPGFYWARFDEDDRRFEPVELREDYRGKLWVIILGVRDACDTCEVSEWGPRIELPEGRRL